MSNNYCPNCNKELTTVNSVIRQLYNIEYKYKFLCTNCMIAVEDPHSVNTPCYSPELTKITVAQRFYGQFNGYDNCHYLST